MQPEIESLYSYPYIHYIDYKEGVFDTQEVSSAILIWNAKCSLKCSINSHEMVIPSNTIILLDKGNVFSFQKNDISQIKIIEFNAEVFSNSLVFACGFINKSCRRDFKKYTLLFFENEQMSFITNTFSEVQNLLSSGLLLDIKKLNAVICRLLQNALKEKFVSDPNYINCFGELLNKQFNIFHNVSDYALQLGIEPKNLLRLFQKSGLKNPSEIIKEKLLLESKKLIVYTDKSMREICFEVGFYDPAYFSRFFKKHTGVTAQHFREQYVNI
ncbi:MAG: AraC family transcriptional regulator [Winogradskyella sp.]|nr:MAG: AraC family transcriptional regulator [Winogradskyella sp.]